MEYHRRVTVVASHHPSATEVRTGDVIGIAAPIQQQEHLPTAIQRLADRRLHPWADQVHAPVVPPLALGDEVNDLDDRQAHAGHTVVDSMETIIAFFRRVMPGFQRRRGAAEYDRAVGQLGTAQGDVSAVVTRNLILFVRAVVLLVDDDQSETTFRDRREDR